MVSGILSYFLLGVRLHGHRRLFYSFTGLLFGGRAASAGSTLIREVLYVV